MFIINYFVDPAKTPAPPLKKNSFGLGTIQTGRKSLTAPEPRLWYISKSAISGISLGAERLFFIVMLAATLTTVSSALAELLRFVQS